ncbi:hypothetical protein SEA_KARDASHIAN_64 [Streptomyces phage Kardashian]|nr:hypothetical protein SEA_KARDASHIAN_64 [Streptomyces phage Kardashian]
MAYTGHGYHIPGSNRGEGVTKAVAPTGCGGPENGCPRCISEVNDYQESMVGSYIDYQQLAIDTLRWHLTPQMTPDTSVFSIYVEMFSKTLRNWKAVMGTTLDDCMLYVLTYDGAKKQTYITSYHRNENVVIPD